MKILIVDDNQDLAFLIKWMLEDEGYDVRSAQMVVMGTPPTFCSTPTSCLRIFKCQRKMAWS